MCITSPQLLSNLRKSFKLWVLIATLNFTFTLTFEIYKKKKILSKQSAVIKVPTQQEAG